MLLVSLALAAIASTAMAAVVQTEGLRITVLGQVLPFRLPRDQVAPVAVFISGSVKAVDGSLPPQLQKMVIRINRYGQLQPHGIPTCTIKQIQPGTTERALANCGDALVGSGRFWASVVLPEQRAYATRGSTDTAPEFVIPSRMSKCISSTGSGSTNGRIIVVKGKMAHQRPRGCHFTRGHRKAVCRARGVHRIEIQMGPHGDMVRVAEKMPFPLVVYLGPGSDKFVGNAERDFCFPGGARRNRCVGRGNNDVCITGNRNSDCVGGGGNDYCRHGNGSDGCWGGRGNDVCIMGGGQDGCHGGPGRDRLYGGPQADQLYGGRGWDYCNGQRGWGKSHGCNAGPRR